MFMVFLPKKWQSKSMTISASFGLCRVRCYMESNLGVLFPSHCVLHSARRLTLGLLEKGLGDGWLAWRLHSWMWCSTRFPARCLSLPQAAVGRALRACAWRQSKCVAHEQSVFLQTVQSRLVPRLCFQGKLLVALNLTTTPESLLQRLVGFGLPSTL